MLLLYRSRLPEQVDAQSLTRADSAEPPALPSNAATMIERLRALIGAQQWQLFRDLEREGVWREVFLVEAGCSTCACWIA